MKTEIISIFLTVEKTHRRSILPTSALFHEVSIFNMVWIWSRTSLAGIHIERQQLYHLPHLRSTHGSLGISLEKESPAKQRLSALFHLLWSSKWSEWEPAGQIQLAGWFPLLTAFSAWPQSAAKVGRKEKGQANNCHVSFSYITRKTGLSLQSRKWQTFPQTGLQSTALKTRAFLSRMQTLISTVSTPMKMFSINSKRKNGKKRHMELCPEQEEWKDYNYLDKQNN